MHSLAEARLVALGNLEPNLKRLRTDAPTASELFTHLVCQCAASWQSALTQGDIKQAFLRGEFPEGKRVYLVPPREGLEGGDGD